MAAVTVHLPTLDPQRPPAARVRVLGCGRWLRCDDQVGLRAAESLRARLPPECEVLASQSPGVDLLAAGGEVDLLVIVDASRATAQCPVGTPIRLIWRSPGAPGPRARIAADSAHASPHLLSVGQALALADSLGSLPRHVWIYAVAGRSFDFGEQISADVEPGLAAITDWIAADVSAWLRCWHRAHL